MRSLLKDKKVLITAGPTWVPIDSVRVISNISSGLTGITIAQYAARKGANVTVLLGPATFEKSKGKRKKEKLKIIRFKYFDELQKLITQELRRHKYDIIIHAAAVSDYRPAEVFKGKLKSGKKILAVFLRPTVKIIDKIRAYAPSAFLVMFKLEVKKGKRELLEAAYKNMRRSKANLAVANNLEGITENRHGAYIIDSQKNVVAVKTKDELADRLFKIIAKKL